MKDDTPYAVVIVFAAVALAIVLMIWSLAGTSGGRQVATTTGTITPRKPRPQRRLLPRRPTTRVLPARDSLKGPTPRSTSRLPPRLSGAEYYWCDGEPLKVRGGRFGTSRSSEVQNRRIVLKKSFFADDRKFSAPPARLSRCEVRDHINYRKNDRWPSYRFYRA